MNLKHFVVPESKKILKKGKRKTKTREPNRNARKKTGRKYAEMIRMVALR